MKNQQLIVKQLDRQLKKWAHLSKAHGRPKGGWIKTLRKSLGMTGAQFAERLGVSRARLMQLERAEALDAVTLKTLKKAAAAINCELVYVIVPKGPSSKSTLKGILKTRAENIAKKKVLAVAHNMALEKQSTTKKQLNELKQELMKSLLEHPTKKLWEDK